MMDKVLFSVTLGGCFWAFIALVAIIVLWEVLAGDSSFAIKTRRFFWRVRIFPRQFSSAWTYPDDEVFPWFATFRKNVLVVFPHARRH